MRFCISYFNIKEFQQKKNFNKKEFEKKGKKEVKKQNFEEERQILRVVRRRVSKGVEDGHRSPAQRAATPETTVKPSQGWPPAGR
jgi:hypothetical protein